MCGSFVFLIHICVLAGVIIKQCFLSANANLKATNLERAVFEVMNSHSKILWSISSSNRNNNLNFVHVYVNIMRQIFGWSLFSCYRKDCKIFGCYHFSSDSQSCYLLFSKFTALPRAEIQKLTM